MKVKVIMVTGTPKSGNTWLQNVFKRHKEIDHRLIVNYSGLEKGEYDLYNLRGKVNYLFAPHGNMVLDSIVKYCDENNLDLRIVHLIRDGKDCSSSYISRKEVKTPTQAIKMWTNFIKAGREYQNYKKYIEIRYEELCKNPKDTLKQIMKFCDLEYQELEINVVSSNNTFEQLSEEHQKEIIKYLENHDLLKDGEINYDNL